MMSLTADDALKVPAHSYSPKQNSNCHITSSSSQLSSLQVLSSSLFCIISSTFEGLAWKNSPRIGLAVWSSRILDLSSAWPQVGLVFWSFPPEKYRYQVGKQNAASLQSIVQTLGDVLNHPLGILVEHGVVLDDHQGVTGLFKKIQIVVEGLGERLIWGRQGIE
jgi:hypothetical protein